MAAMSCLSRRHEDHACEDQCLAIVFLNIELSRRASPRRTLAGLGCLRQESRSPTRARRLKSERDLEHRDDGLASFGVVDELQSDVGFVCGKDELFWLESPFKPASTK
jgi:hypothetical protein